MTVSQGLPLQNEPISQLPTAGTLTGAELTVVVQNGVTSQTTLALVNTIPVAGGAVPTSRQISTSPPLHGGGALTGDLSLTIDTTGITITAAQITGILPKANAATGTATPALVAGTNITITGSWPAQTINATTTGTVTSVDTGTGLTGGPITATGTVALAAIANGAMLANISGGSAAPTAHTVSAVLDATVAGASPADGQIVYRNATQWITLNPASHVGDILIGTPGSNPSINWQVLPIIMDAAAPVGFGNTQGSIIYRGASGWVALAPGTDGDLLTTHGANANPSWTNATGTGTVTSITAGTGLSGGTITASGTIALADTAVTPAAYTLANVTIDQQGRITAASSTADVAIKTAAAQWSGAQVNGATPVTLPDAAPTAWNMALGNTFVWTLAGSHLLSNPTNSVSGGSGVLYIDQGGFTATFGANIKLVGTLPGTGETICGYYVRGSNVTIVVAGLTGF